MKSSSSLRIWHKVICALLALSLAMTAFLPPFAQVAYACYTWAVGQRVGLKGGTQIRHGPGFNYAVHTTLPADANNWQVDIIDGPRYADGQEWWDISRVNIDGGGTGWVYKAQAGWDLCPPPSGNIYIAQGLELVPDPPHSFPPYEGDKLIGLFTLGNNGSASIRLTGWGVRMRRNNNPDDYWDFLNVSTYDLAPGQTIRFDQNNERPLSTGHYRAEITWQENGGSWKTANPIEFDVYSRPAMDNVYVVSGLELVPDPAHGFPPYEGDKLIGRFTLGNNGGTTARLEGFGVRLRRNHDPNDYWDFLNTSGWDLAPGSTVRFDQNNERPLAAGHYHAEITWKVNGRDWQVSSLTEFDVVPRPGDSHQLTLVDDLSLRSDGSGSWPPVPGDKLIAHLRVRNSGSANLKIDHIGVRGRRNGSENWDIGWWSINLAPGEEWSFDANNERFLQNGGYSFRISYNVGGVWTEIGSEKNFTIGAVSSPVDDAILKGKVGEINAPPGSVVVAWVELFNSGGTTWDDDDGYSLQALGDSFGAQVSLPLGREVSPGQTRRWQILMTAPQTNASSLWQLQRYGVGFGPVISFDFVPSDAGSAPSSGDFRSLQLVQGIQLTPPNPSLGQVVEASYVIRNPTSQAIQVPHLGVSGRSPAGGPYDNDVQYNWDSYSVIPPYSEYTVRVTQSFHTPGPYGFYPAVRMDGDLVPFPITERGVGPEAWLEKDIWRYVNITESSSAPLTQCKVSWDDADSQNPLLDKASNMIGVKCTNVEYDPVADVMTVDLEIENRLQLILQQEFFVSSGVIDPQNLLDRRSLIFPSSGLIPGIDPSVYVIENVRFNRSGVLIIHTWRKTSDLEFKYVILWVLDLASYLALGSHIGNSFDDNVENVEDLITEVTDKITRAEGGVELFANLYGYASDPKSVFKNPLKTIEDVVNGFKTITKIQEAAPRVHYLYVKAGTSGASSLTLSQMLERLSKAFAYLRLIGLMKDYLFWPKSATVTITATTNPNVWSFSDGANNDGHVAHTSTLEGSVQGNIALSASGERVPSNERFRLIDGSFASGWAADLPSVGNAWAEIQLANGAPVLVNAIEIYPGPTGSFPAAAALKDFHIEYSLDQMNYQTLLSGSFQPAEVGQPKLFVVDPPILAGYMRLVVDSIQDPSAASFVNIGELQVFGTVGARSDPYEVDDLPSAAPGLLIGRAAYHNTSYPGDQDWMQFFAQANNIYRIETRKLGPEADTVLEIYDQDGVSRLAWNDDAFDGTRASLLEWVAPADGYYFIRVTHWDPNDYGPGTEYELQVLGANDVYLPLIGSGSR